MITILMEFHVQRNPRFLRTMNLYAAGLEDLPSLKSAEYAS